MKFSASRGKNRLNFKGCFQYFMDKKKKKKKESGADFFGLSSHTKVKRTVHLNWKICEMPGSLD